MKQWAMAPKLARGEELASSTPDKQQPAATPEARPRPSVVPRGPISSNPARALQGALAASYRSAVQPPKAMNVAAEANRASMRRAADPTADMEAADAEAGVMQQPVQPEEAAKKATALMTPPDTAADHLKPLESVDIPLLVQRACKSDCECKSCSSSRSLQRKDAAGGAHEVPSPAAAENSLGTGAPLAPSLVAQYSPAFGRDLSSVRVHTASPVSADMGARAFTVGNHVAFSPGEYNPATAGGQRLIAHELAHVVQQSGGAGDKVQGSGLSYDGYEAEADAAADQIAAGESVSGLTPVHESGGAVQGYFGESVVNAVGGAIEEGAELVGDAAVDAFWALVRSVAPSVEPYLRDPSKLWDKIVDGVMSGIDSLINGVFDFFKGGFFGDAASIFTSVATELAAVVGGLAKGDCGPLAAALGKVFGIFSKFVDSVFGPISDAIKAISGAIKTVIDKVAKPIIDLVKLVASGIYDFVSDIVDGVMAVGRAVGSAIGWVWDKIKSGLGISSDGEGIWDWIKRKAGEAWDAVKDDLLKWVDPLITVGKVLLVLSPVGPLILLFKYGPKIIHFVKEVWAIASDPQKIAAQAAKVRGALEPVKSFITEAAGVLAGIAPQVTAALTAILGPLGTLAGAVAGSVVKLLAKAVNWFLGVVQDAADFVASHIVSVCDKIVAFLHKVYNWIHPVLDLVAKIIWVVSNPFGLAGLFFSWVWEAIPHCIKVEVVKFILDVLIKFITAMPDAALAALGLLAPLVKHAVLGFLETLRGDIEKAVTAMDRVVKLLGQGSFEFVAGLAVGLLSGIWDGLIGPFEMIFSIIEGVGALVEWLEKMATGGEKEAVEKATEAQVAPGAPKPPPPPPTISQKLVGRLKGIWQSIKSNFWPALKSVFSPTEGGGDPVGKMMAFLADAWDAIAGAASDIGGAIAGALISYIMKSDYDLGHDVGWVAGQIVFTIAIGYLTGGAYPVVQKLSGPVGAVVKFVVNVHKITNEVFEAILGAIKPLKAAMEGIIHAVEKIPGLKAIFAEIKGLVEGITDAALAGMEKKAAAEATTAVTEAGAKAVGTAAEKKVVGGAAESKAGEAVPTSEVKPPAGPEVKPPEGPGAAATEGKPTPTEGKPPTEEPGAPKPNDESVAASGKKEKITQPEAEAEMKQIGDHPQTVKGEPPNRTAKVGEHEWKESPIEGQPGKTKWCRYSGMPTSCQPGAPPGIKPATEAETASKSAIDDAVETTAKLDKYTQLREKYAKGTISATEKAEMDALEKEVGGHYNNRLLDEMAADAGKQAKLNDLRARPADKLSAAEKAELDELNKWDATRPNRPPDAPPPAKPEPKGETAPPKDEAAPPKKDEGAPPKKDEAAPPKDEAAPPKKDEAAPPKKDEAAPPKKEEGAPPKKDEAAPPKKDEAAPPKKEEGAPPKKEEPAAKDDSSPTKKEGDKEPPKDEAGKTDPSKPKITADEQKILDEYHQNVKKANRTLSDEDVLAEIRSGKKFNPKTKRFYDPNVEAKPDITADPKPLNEMPGSELADNERVAKALRDRDAAIARRDAAPTQEAKDKISAEVNEASRTVGDEATNVAVPNQYPGAKKVYPPPGTPETGFAEQGSKSGDFDQVWEKPDGKIVVAESKGGSADLGSRKIEGTPLRAEQGTREYYDEIVKAMQNSKNPATRAIGDRLAKIPPDKVAEQVEYVLVKAPIEKEAGKSVAEKIVVKKFDISSYSPLTKK